MKQTAISILVIAAVLGSAAAWYLTGRQAERTITSIEAAPLLPDLRGDVEEIATVKIITKSEKITLQRGDDVWKISEKSGYPAKLENVRQLILQLSDLQTLEAMTKNAKQHNKLDLMSPDSTDVTKESEGVGSLVVLEGKGGEEIASVVIGRRKFGAPGAPAELLFVRQASSDQTWLAKGRVDVYANLSRWADTQVARIERDRIQKVAIDHADDTEDLTLLKEEKAQRDFTMADVPEGMKVKSTATLGSVAGALSYLSFTDVLPVADVDFATSPGAVAEYRTWDGLVIRSILTEQNNKDYLKLEVELDEELLAAREAEAEADDPTEEEAAFSPDPADRFKSPDDVRQEAAELKAKVEGWAYEFAGATVINLSKKKSELIDPVTQDVAPEDIPVSGLPEGALDSLSPEERAALMQSIQNSMAAPTAGETAPNEPFTVEALGSPELSLEEAALDAEAVNLPETEAPDEMVSPEKEDTEATEADESDAEEAAPEVEPADKDAPTSPTVADPN